MFTVALIVFMLVVWCIPGLFVARGLYTKQVKEINAQPATVVPPKPKRPDIEVEEMLHATLPAKCGILREIPTISCTCKYRTDWIKLKNDWFKYDEWIEKYGHITNGVAFIPEPSIRRCLVAVPGWPVVLASAFIKGGAKNMPDYAYIERMEAEMRELD